jgi:hypothetical protein
MGLEFGNTTVEQGQAPLNHLESQHRGARLLAMPTGWFLGSVGGVLPVSRHLGSGYAEIVTMRVKMGAVRFGKLCMAFGIGSSDFGTTSMESWWVCTGLPAIGKYPALDCTADKGKKHRVSRVGTNIDDHPFVGLLLCQHCHRGMERRELEYYVIWNEYPPRRQELEGRRARERQ